MGLRKSSSDSGCYWGPIPTEDSFPICDRGSLKREALRTDVGAGLGFLQPVLCVMPERMMGS